MLDPKKIEQIAESYSPQEIFAALVWQRHDERVHAAN